MLSYEEFKTNVIVWFDNFLKNNFGDAKLYEEKVVKNNCTLTGIACEINDECKDVRTTFYVEELYEKYQLTNDFRGLMERTGDNLVKAMKDRKVILEQTTNHRDVPANLYFTLVNTTQNKELLGEIPHRDFMNLSIVYRWLITLENGEKASAFVTNEVAEKLGMDEQRLYELANDNTEKVLGIEVMPIQEYVMERIIEDRLEGLPELFAQREVFDMSPYVVTNKYMHSGAINVIYPKVLKPIAEKFDSDLYLIPTSINEMMIASAEEEKLELFAKQLHEGNAQLNVLERLSNEIYMYDRNSQNIVQVTNFGDASLVDENDFSEIENDNMGMEMG